MVFLFDEFIIGVDFVFCQEFWEMLQWFKAKNIIIFVFMFYMDEVSLCDCVVFMQDGVILQVDELDSIVNSYDKLLLAVKIVNIY